MSRGALGCPMVSCGQPGCPRMSRGLLGAGSGAGPSRCPRGWAVPGARSLPALVSPGIQEAPGRAGRAGAGQPHHRDHRQRGGERRERGGAPGRGRFGTGMAVLGYPRGCRLTALACGSQLLPERTKCTRLCREYHGVPWSEALYRRPSLLHSAKQSS